MNNIDNFCQDLQKQILELPDYYDIDDNSGEIANTEKNKTIMATISQLNKLFMEFKCEEKLQHITGGKTSIKSRRTPRRINSRKLRSTHRKRTQK
jgi:hypothetical protein